MFDYVPDRLKKIQDSLEDQFRNSEIDESHYYFVMLSSLGEVLSKYDYLIKNNYLDIYNEYCSVKLKYNNSFFNMGEWFYWEKEFYLEDFILDLNSNRTKENIIDDYDSLIDKYYDEYYVFEQE